MFGKLNVQRNIIYSNKTKNLGFYMTAGAIYD